jgi:hypothetical protein
MFSTNTKENIDFKLPTIPYSDKSLNNLEKSHLEIRIIGKRKILSKEANNFVLEFETTFIQENKPTQVKGNSFKFQEFDEIDFVAIKSQVKSYSSSVARITKKLIETSFEEVQIKDLKEVSLPKKKN